MADGLRNPPLRLHALGIANGSNLCIAEVNIAEISIAD
jgi:hypothetical protein